MLGESGSPKGLLAAPIDAPNGLAVAAPSSMGEAPSSGEAPNGLTDEASFPLGEAPSCRFSSAADPDKSACGDSGSAQGSPGESTAACGAEGGEPSEAVAMLLRSGGEGEPAVTASC